MGETASGRVVAAIQDRYVAIRRFAAWSVAVVAAAFVVIAPFGVRYLTSDFQHTEDLHQARQASADLSLSLLQEEAALRGFTSTRQPRYAVLYSSAKAKFDAQFSNFSTWTRAIGLGPAAGQLADIGRFNTRWTSEVASRLLAAPSGPRAIALQDEGEFLIERMTRDFISLTLTIDQAIDASANE